MPRVIPHVYTWPTKVSASSSSSVLKRKVSTFCHIFYFNLLLSRELGQLCDGSRLTTEFNRVLKAVPIAIAKQ